MAEGAAAADVQNKKKEKEKFLSLGREEKKPGWRSQSFLLKNQC